MSIADLGSTDATIGTVVTDGINFPTGTTLTGYAAVGVSGTFSGPFGIHGPVPSQGLLRVFGKAAFLSMDGIFAQTDNNGVITFSTVISPAPAQTMNFPIYVTNPATLPGGLPGLGNCQISNTGIMTIFVGFSGLFTGASNVGFQTFTVCYPIA